MTRRGSVDSEQRSRRVVFHRFGGAEVLDIEWRSVPGPAAGEVLVRVAAAGVNPVDWKLFRRPALLLSLTRPEHPACPAVPAAAERRASETSGG